MSGAADRPTPGPGLGAVRLLAGCVLLVGIAFIQSPGLLVADTKFDLAIDPAGFLGRALHLWDASGAFGQLQNQAYGYLWPMGPVFALGGAVDLPGWVVQRLWMALVLCTAFTGTARLSRALGVRSDVACLVAAFAYATSPRILTTIGPISIEAWPSALAPWVLLPLVTGSVRGSARRAALLSALAVAMVGGVNAAATFAVLPLGAVWILTRTAGPRRRALMWWWPVFTVAATAWWLVPLFVLGAYSPPFLDFIETASVTTFPTTLFDALRGTSDWVPYVDSSWQGGHTLITQSYLALDSGLLVMLGVVGLLQAANPHRRFLLLSVLTGLLLVTLGHQGSVQGWFAAPLNALLDGALAPIRNVHKFDPVVRLPLTLALAWLLESVARQSTVQTLLVRGRSLRLTSRATVTGLAVLAVVGASAPALGGGLAPTRPVVESPDYWQQAVDWLGDNEPGSVALLAPGSSFASYLWGTPRDEPFQYLSASSWAVRNAIPLAPPGNIRMLDAFEERMAQGEPSPGLAQFLARAGVGHVVVRNDLQPDSDIPDPVLVHQALTGSPGLRVVREFGPEVGGAAYLETDEGRLVVNGGWQTRRPAIEVYEVRAGAQQTSTSGPPPVVVGGPEDLADLVDAGVVGDEPTRLALDLSAEEASDRPPGRWVLTDGLLDRERFFGRVHDASSAVITPGDVSRTGNPVSTYALPGEERWSTRASLTGAATLSASSSRSDADAAGGSRPGELPYAAVDGDPTTSWRSGTATGSPAWWRVGLDERTEIPQVTVQTGQEGPERSEVRVTTDGGADVTVGIARGARRTVALPGGAATWVMVAGTSSTSEGLSLAEVSVPGLAVRRRLVLPSVPVGWGSPDDIVLRSLRDGRSGCAVVAGRTPCVGSRAVASEEPHGFDRVLSLGASATYASRLVVRPDPGPELDTVIQRGQLLNATGSSTGPADPRASGIAAIDGDIGTTWTPSLDDARPQLALNWVGERSIDRIRVSLDPSAPARRVTEATLVYPGGERDVELDARGRAVFPALVTDRLTVRVTASEASASIDSQGVGEELPVGIGEVRLRGLQLEPLTLDDTVRTRDCGSGPRIFVDGEQRRTRLVASAAQLYAMEPARALLCGLGVVALGAGEHEITATEKGGVVADTLVLTRADDADEVAVPVAPADVTATGPDRRVISPEAGSSALVLRQNVNAGWQARQGGRALRPLVLDGWQQGWVVDGSDDPVTATFGPDRTYRWGILGGGVLAVLLALLVLLPRRRWPGHAHPALAARDPRRPVLCLLGLLAAGALAGWPGLLVGVVGGIAGLLGSRWARDSAPWIIGTGLLLASGAYAVRPWGNPLGWAGAWSWPHYLVLLSLAAACGVLVAERPTSFSRMTGSSTSR